jgi:hypothetical protein
MPPAATTQLHYEQRVSPYLKKSHRNFVDDADQILIGKFKYSKSKKAHQLEITDVLKSPVIKIPKKPTSVTFKAIGDDRITYVKREKEDYTDSGPRWGSPIPFYFGIEGTYGPGDCRMSLEIESKTNYLIFMNETNQVTSMFSINEWTLPLQHAIQKMIENPNDEFGVSRTIQQVLKRGTKIRLLETQSCTPAPSYTTLSSSHPNEEGKKLSAQPILVFETVQTKSEWDLNQDELEQARSLGLIQGHYTNAPELAACINGQRYLSLGTIQYSNSEHDLGQMIPDQDGYFDLRETIFEHHITPELIGYNVIKASIDSHKSK